MPGVSGISGLAVQPFGAGGGITWLLRDDFLDVRAPGSVHNTPAVPGPGLRYVVDTDNDALAVNSGVLSFPNFNAIGNPGLWYGGFSRTLGRMVFMRAIQIPNGRVNAGWAYERTSIVRAVAHKWDVSTKLSQITGTDDLDAWRYSTATPYQTAVVLGNPGGYAFIKGGTQYPKWTLLHRSFTGTNGTVYPGITKWDNVFPTFSTVRVPEDLWLPPTLAYDTFTRADGPMGSTETTGPDGQSIASYPWSTKVGTWSISLTKAHPDAVSGSKGVVTIDTGNKDAYVSVQGGGATGGMGLVLRYVDSSNYVYLVWTDGGLLQLWKRISAVDTKVGEVSLAYQSNTRMMAWCKGTTFTYGARSASSATPTHTIDHAVINSSTLHGMFTSSTFVFLDNFLWLPVGGNDEYEFMDEYFL